MIGDGLDGRIAEIEQFAEFIEPILEEILLTNGR